MGQEPDQLTAEALRAQIGQQRADLGRDLEAVGDRVSPGRIYERRTEAVRSSFRGAKERVMGAAGSASSAVGDASASIGDRASHAPDASRQAVEGNPLAVGLVAFGAGALLATLIPTSRREERFGEEQATPALRQAAAEVGSIASDAVDELKPAAEQAVESVKGSAQDAVETVKGDAQDAAQTVKGEAQGAAQDVRGSGER